MRIHRTYLEGKKTKLLGAASKVRSDVGRGVLPLQRYSSVVSFNFHYCIYFPLFCCKFTFFLSLFQEKKDTTK